MSARLVVGLFVGGRGRRMGGVAKGNLLGYDGRPLLSRLTSVVTLALPGAPIVLVGAAAAYADRGLRALEDTPVGVGPIGGLAALLTFAREQGHQSALALSCDLPYLDAGMIRRLASEFEDAHALAPREAERWSPLTARYAESALPAVLEGIAQGVHSLQRVFERLGAGARELPLSAEERRALRDWDRPEDMLE